MRTSSCSRFLPVRAQSLCEAAITGAMYRAATCCMSTKGHFLRSCSISIASYWRASLFRHSRAWRPIRQTPAHNSHVADSGALVYIPGVSSGQALVPVLWMDRQGRTTPLRRAAADWSNPDFSPDGRALAIDLSDGRGTPDSTDIWVYDWMRDILSRLTFGATADEKPVWTPDGRRIAFRSKRGDNSTFNLYWQRADGTGEVERLTQSSNDQFPASWHPSGKFLSFVETTQNQFPDDPSDRRGRGDRMEARQADGVPGHAVHRTGGNVFAGRPMAGVRIQRDGDVRDLCAALSRSGRQVASLDRRRKYPNMVAKSTRAVLSGA